MWSPTIPTSFRSAPTPRVGPSRRCRGSRVRTELDLCYLDEDGDGMLDAVVITERLVTAGPGARTVLDRRRIVLHGVDDAGLARWIAVERA